MSFLNPVNEPVLRFSSTDAGAPQINYNARVAGDVKAVLKACLVTGYGSKSSAGWSVVNEVNHVAEFVSPSVAMSDYRLGIDDASTSSTTWYYQYQNVRTNPTYNEPVKSITHIDKASSNNGWQLLVTERGFYFIEIFYHTDAKKTLARVLWLGQVKSALVDNTGINMSYFCTGFQAQVSTPNQLFDISSNGDIYRFYRLATLTRVDFNSANMQAFAIQQKQRGLAIVDTVSEVFLSNTGNVVGKQPALMLRDINNNSDALGVFDTIVNGRPALDVAVSVATASAATTAAYSKRLVLHLDYWEY